MNVQENVPLAPHTTFHIGGPARFFTQATSLKEIEEACAFAKDKDLPIFVLGGGSNILVADEGFLGLVLMVDIQEIIVEEKDGRIEVVAGAGVAWDDLVAHSVRRGYAGLECLSGIPGTVGGAVVANLGAYGAEVSDTLVSVEVLDREDVAAGVKIVSNSECMFSYHESVFGRAQGRYIVLRATFKLSRDASVVAYRDHRFDLATASARGGKSPSLTDVRNAVLDVREQKGLVCMSGRVSFQSAGSFFRTLYVSAEQHANIQARARELDFEKEEKLRPWSWLQTNGSYKVAAGFLLEFTEFPKGYVRGPVGVSPRHQLSIINVSGATAHDVAELARDMRDAVKKIFNVQLQREAEYVGNVENNKKLFFK